jgi:DNA-binding transcriptional MerR regulator
MIRDHLTITDVAHIVGLKPWTLRRLEALGRIPKPCRDPYCGRRIYSQRDVAQLQAALATLAREHVPMAHVEQERAAHRA